MAVRTPNAGKLFAKLSLEKAEIASPASPDKSKFELSVFFHHTLSVNDLNGLTVAGDEAFLLKPIKIGRAHV